MLISRNAARALRGGQLSTTAFLISSKLQKQQMYQHLRTVRTTTTSTRILNQQIAPIISIGSAEWNGWSSSSFHTRLLVAAALLVAGGTTVGRSLALLEQQSQQQGPPDTAARESAETSSSEVHAKSQDSVAAAAVVVLNQPPPRPDLPIYTLAEVAEHCDEENGLWYTFRGGVYDMTFFLNGHPGGMPRLLMAAGQDLEPYWHIYRQHFRGHVTKWMEKYRIGNLSPDETAIASSATVGDMYEHEPERHPDLMPATLKPFNGEPRIELLTDDYLTPNEIFYTRCHLAVPDIDPNEYRLVVMADEAIFKKKTFTLEQLKAFPKHEVLQCAGNRREDLNAGDHNIFIAPHWVIGAMSTAKWGGVKLRDVLRECGLNVDALALGEIMPPGGIKHVQLEGYDQDETGYTYGGSFPIEKAFDGLGDVILAYEMNGETLPQDHGFPVRMIIPGHVGARQVKWLHKIRLSDRPSSKSYQCKSYRGFAPNITFEEHLSDWPPPRLDQAPVIHEQPVTSIICHPPQNAILGAKRATDISLKGVAWSGGGRKIERVDVSVDGGKTWKAADLYKPIEQRYNRHWAWTQFHITVVLPEDIREKLSHGEVAELDITSKALDSAFNVQPETMEPYWNARGIAINHWYHVKVKLDPTVAKGKVSRQTPEEGSPNTPSGGAFDKPWGMGGWKVDPKHNDQP